MNIDNGNLAVDIESCTIIRAMGKQALEDLDL